MLFLDFLLRLSHRDINIKSNACFNCDMSLSYSNELTSLGILVHILILFLNDI